ncbi:MAG: nucleotidyl transferase AbiEii/AbiGii toxin family protein [Candidatus Azambacteria bacterium]|nr:nucleotidyl transferase AbiEii/AbiGii toxin family protein [Candidatus Azambacteria bacterium]
MTLHRETITDAMYDAARGIFDNFDTEYYLAGGTALALRIGHRKSVDLDYFIAKPIDTIALKRDIGEIFSSVKTEILFEEKNTLWCVINGVKVSFISRFDLLLDPVEIVDCFRLASMKDIAVMKLIAVCGRDEYKDYFDLACIGDETDVRSWMYWWQEIYPNQDITSWIVALSAADMVKKVPIEIGEKCKGKDVISDMKRIVQEITKQVRLSKEV